MRLARHLAKTRRASPRSGDQAGKTLPDGRIGRQGLSGCSEQALNPTGEAPSGAPDGPLKTAPFGKRQRPSRLIIGEEISLAPYIFPHRKKPPGITTDWPGTAPEPARGNASRERPHTEKASVRRVVVARRVELHLVVTDEARALEQAVSQPDAEKDRQADVGGDHAAPVDAILHEGLVVLAQGNDQTQHEGKDRPEGKEGGPVRWVNQSAIFTLLIIPQILCYNRGHVRATIKQLSCLIGARPATTHSQLYVAELGWYLAANSGEESARNLC